MRKFNAVLSISVLVLFLVHAVSGAFQLMGITGGGSVILNIISWAMLGLIILHIIIGIKLTADSLKAVRKSGVSYKKENRIFWVRRISGFAIILFILCHVIIFIGKSGEAFRLNYFGTVQLISQIMLIISIAVHVLSNIKPLLIAMGVRGFKDIFVDALYILSIILFFSGTGFIIYYLRWNVF
ncbi:MAG: hypothetical protein IJ666_00920 [Ruminococcus sp.]|nr:hypothetical protein [Ruminococcus sp.]